MRYAQFVMGARGSGKSTYCKLMSKYAESRGRKVNIVNLDPMTGPLPYEVMAADIRDVIPPSKYLDTDKASSTYGSAMDFTISYVVEHPEWLFKAIGEDGENDHTLFDFIWEDTGPSYSQVMNDFAKMLATKNFRACIVFIRNSKSALDGYGFIASCLTPLTICFHMGVPHVNVMMKFDTLTEEEKSKLLLFINSDIRDVLRYENTRLKESISAAAAETQGSSPSQAKYEQVVGIAKACSAAATIVDGHHMIRRKYFPLHIEQEMSLKGCLAFLDDALRISND